MLTKMEIGTIIGRGVVYSTILLYEKYPHLFKFKLREYFFKRCT